VRRLKKRQPRQYPGEPMKKGGMSREEHVAVALMGGTVDIHVKLRQGRFGGKPRAWLESGPWFRGGTDDPADNGYLVRVGEKGGSAEGAPLRVTRVGLEQHWDVMVPWKWGTHHFKFRHDNLTVLVHVEMTLEDPDS